MNPFQDPEHKEEAIDRYLRKEMSSEEKAAFEKALSEDSELRKETEWMASIVRGLDRFRKNRESEQDPAE
jgi:hypothetical protein